MKGLENRKVWRIERFGESKGLAHRKVWEIERFGEPEDNVQVKILELFKSTLSSDGFVSIEEPKSTSGHLWKGTKFAPKVFPKHANVNTARFGTALGTAH